MEAGLPCTIDGPAGQALAAHSDTVTTMGTCIRGRRERCCYETTSTVGGGMRDFREVGAHIFLQLSAIASFGESNLTTLVNTRTTRLGGNITLA